MSEFDQRARDWDNDPSKWSRAEAVANGIREAVPLRPEMNALEYGCGTGLLSFALHRDLGRITLADSSPGMLQVLAEKIQAAGIDTMTPIRLDLGVDPLPPDRFALICTMMTRPLAQSLSAAVTATSTVTLRSLISTARPRSSSSVPIGVGAR